MAISERTATEILKVVDAWLHHSFRGFNRLDMSDFFEEIGQVPSNTPFTESISLIVDVLRRKP